jgi:hypothetical protein
MRFQILCSLLLGLGILGLTSSKAGAASPVRRLTRTGDVMEFAWAPGADALYITRAGETLTLSSTRAQVTGQLYRVAAGDGQVELLAQNVNTVRPSAQGNPIALTRLDANGSVQLMTLDLQTHKTRPVDTVTWGILPQWSGAGDTLYYLKGTTLNRSTALGGQAEWTVANVPSAAVISPLGDRLAFVNADGLAVTQNGATRTLVHSTAERRVAAEIHWSHRGDRLAFMAMDQALNPELWVADTNNGMTARLARGQFERFANLAWVPDDAYLLFTRTPTGSSSAGASEIWRAATDGSETRALTSDKIEETLPQYAPDGRAIGFISDGDLWVMELNPQGLPIAQLANESTGVKPPPGAPAFQRTPPPTIRVLHAAANSCRSVPVGQIDTLDFESYVKRVVPAEVYPTWADNALKTQAVAARTYAWFWIVQHTGGTFDVSDSTAYQYMCDARYASTDNATDATRGQYLDYAGYLVFAAYGAENGDPTLSNTWGNPYLIGIDDPVGFRKTRAGNGLGMSQWGAQRWASQYGWDYQQILIHYYSNVTVEAPAGILQDATPPIGALVTPWSNWGVTSNLIRLLVNASDDSSGVQSIDLNAQYLLNGTPVSETLATLTGGQRAWVWDVSSLANQNRIRITPVIRDTAGNTSNGAGVTFDLDRKRPTGTLNAPATTTSQNVTLNLSASDGGGSGLVGMLFSNHWNWEGEDQFVQGNSGSVVNDPDALNGKALRGLVDTNAAGAWYGPYTYDLPITKAYRAYFRLKTDNNAATAEVARLDVVVDGGTTILGVKRLRGTDFRAANSYQEFYVDFFYEGAITNGLEFRVAYEATASLWLDRILVLSYPIPYAPSANWTLANGYGTKQVYAKFTDGAGNISTDAVATIYFGVAPPTATPTLTATATPTPTPVLTPRLWLPFLEKP